MLAQDWLPLLRKAVGPGSVLIGEKYQGNQDFVIIELFERWLKGKNLNSNRTFIHNIEQLKEQFEVFCKEQDAQFALLREKMISFTRAEYRRKIENEKDKARVLPFKGKEYKLVAYLGGGHEGEVYLISHEGSLKVAKAFKSKSNFEKQASILSTLDATKSPAVRILDRDADNNILLLNFVKGLTVADVEAMIRLGEAPSELKNAFLFQHAKFVNSIRQINDGALNGPAKNDFNPHANNSLFNPESSAWSVIDVR